MDRFLAGFSGVGFGFLLFMPSYLFTRQATGAEGLANAPPMFKLPMLFGMAVMLLMPAIFWGILPAKDYLMGRSDDMKV